MKRGLILECKSLVKIADKTILNMKSKNVIRFFELLILIGIHSGCSVNPSQDISERDRLFNSEWKFIRDSLTGAEQPDYDDSGWMMVDLPHDYSIMDLPGEDGPDQVGPFSKMSPGNGNSNGQVMGGTAWYRKSFALEKADEGKTVVLNFDGVYMESEVWVNGLKAGIHKNGYTPFWFDITSLLHDDGTPNVIAVKVDNYGSNSRWYSGSGIYRNVYLTVTEPVHMAVWGVNISTPQIDQSTALVDVELTILNELDEEVNVQIAIRLKDKDGNLAGSAKEIALIQGKSENKTLKQIKVENPSLWTVESPNLYEAEITIEVDDKVSDVYHQTFGIRSIEFSAEKGFLLNGMPVLLKGACMHHDNGLLGAAAFDRAEVRRVEIMKANGFNAIRCAHNPPSEVFLDACDRLGMLVIDEFTDMWESYKTPQDYSRFFKEWWDRDLTDMILRDRNHPSIIMWSIGNEIPESSLENGLRIGNQLAERVRALDNTRVVTEAMSEFLTPGGWENTSAAFEIQDVGGYNYTWTKYESDHVKYPDRIMYASETFPGDAYEAWSAVERLPYVIGDFVWTSMDYLGEVSLGTSSIVPEGSRNIYAFPENFQLPPGINLFDLMTRVPSNWPYFVAGCGDIDVTGEKKAQMLYRDVLWDNSKLEINVHAPIAEGYAEIVSMWGWPDERPIWYWKGSEGKVLQVRVFTKASHVSLQLNGEIIGEKELSAEDKYIAVFDVPYQPGELKAIALENGEEVARKVLSTPGEPTAIRLVAGRNELKAKRSDLAFVKIEVIDENGQWVPQDSINIKLTVSGEGELVASGNANPSDMKSVNRPEISTFKGRAQAIIRPFATEGEITIKAESEALDPGELILSVIGNSHRQVIQD